MATSLPVLRQLVRDLRYRPLPTLIGRQIVVTGFEGVELCLRAAVREAGLEPGTFDPNNFGASIAKYDLIDVSFDAPPDTLDNVETRSGIPVLRELGFVEPEAGEDRVTAMMDETCLDLLAKEVKAGQVYVLLFLTAETPRDHTDPAVRRRMMRLDLPDDYFPRTFVIDDACATNAPSIWLNKHIWL